MSALEIVQAMNSEDKNVAETVKLALPEIAEAVHLIADRLLKVEDYFMSVQVQVVV